MMNEADFLPILNRHKDTVYRVAFSYMKNRQDYRIVNLIAEIASDYFAGNSTAHETTKTVQEQVCALLAQ